MFSRHSFPALLFAALLGTAFGQSTKPQKPASTPETHVDVPAVAARPEDVSTLDGILKAFYDVISGPAGQPRQWSRDRSLYMPEIRFVAMSINKKGRPVAHIVNHQQFVDTSNDYFLKEGFYEQEIHRVTQRFGNIAHIWSTYESRNKADGPVIARGINSLELFWDGTRWWIASNIWDDERKDTPIPPEFLPKK
jgi:hypothetical protein